MPRKKSSDNSEKKFIVIRDTQEKKGFWNFNKSKYCDGVIESHLLTGDYTLEGMEEIFSIERKATTGELAGNVLTKQFVNELKRGNILNHFWVICEFSLQDILSFPMGSNIPPKFWKNLKISSHLLLKKIIEFEMNYNVKFIFAGNSTNAKEVARCIFKRMIEKYGKNTTTK